MKASNEPIVLSGRVFVDKLLAAENPGLSLPEKLVAGDLKLIALVNKSKEKKQLFAGFFSAYIHEGNRWRKFAIRAAAAAEATYMGDGERRTKLIACVKVLRQLKGAVAIWGDRAYHVHNPATYSKVAAKRAGEESATAEPLQAEQKPSQAKAKQAEQEPVQVKPKQAERKPVQRTLF